MARYVLGCLSTLTMMKKQEIQGGGIGTGPVTYRHTGAGRVGSRGACFRRANSRYGETNLLAQAATRKESLRLMVPSGCDAPPTWPEPVATHARLSVQALLFSP